jgi:class 3 adenylate cyclase
MMRNFLDTENANFSLIIDSKILDTVFSNQDNIKLFMMLLLAAKSVCFHSIMPDQKVNIIALMQNNLKFRSTVLTVADGLINAGILHQSAITVDLNKKSRKNKSISADISVSEFSDLGYLILTEGYFIYYRLNKVIHFSIFKEVMLCTVLFLYEFYNNFSGAPLVDYDLIVIIDLLLSVVLIIGVGLFDLDAKSMLSKRSQIVYLLGHLDVYMKKTTLAFYYSEGATLGVIAFYMSTFAFGAIVNGSGFTGDSDCTGVIVFLVLVLTLCEVILLQSRFLKVKALLLHIGMIIFTVLIVLMIYYNKLTLYTLSTDSLIMRADFWIIVLCVPMLCSTVLFIIRYFYFSSLGFELKSRFQSLSYNFEELLEKPATVHSEPSGDLLTKKRLNLKFNSEMVEINYREMINQSIVKILRLSSLAVAVCGILYIVLTFTNVINGNDLSTAITQLIANACFFGLSYWRKMNPSVLTVIISIFSAIAAAFFAVQNPNIGFAIYPAIQAYVGLALQTIWPASLISILSNSLMSIIVGPIVISNAGVEDSVKTIIASIVFSLIITAVYLFASYRTELYRRTQYAFYYSIQAKLEQVSAILSCLLPPFVKKRVKDGVRYIAEEKGVVSVLFCDIYDFNTIVETYCPDELISLLNDVFSRFDKLCSVFGVAKVETVGKTYLACSGLKDSEKEFSMNIRNIPHARRAVEMALEMIREANKVILKNGDTLKLKIGINSGHVTAGVVGYHKPQFSLVGDTVNTASRMASTLTEYNCVQISEETFNLLGFYDGLEFEEKLREVKGKGLMKTKVVRISHFEKIFKFSKLEPTSPYSSVCRQSIYENQANHHALNIIENLIDDKPIKNNTIQEIQVETTNLLKFARMFKGEICLEGTLQECWMEHRRLMLKIGVWIYVIGNIIYILCEVSDTVGQNSSMNQSIAKIPLLTFESLLVVSIYLLRKQWSFIRQIQSLFSMICAIGFVVLVIESIFQSTNDFSIDFLEFYLRFLIINYCSGALVFSNIIPNLLIISAWLFECSFFSLEFSTFLISIVFISYVLFSVCRLEYFLRADANWQSAARKEVDKTEALLEQMMPTHVLQGLQNDTHIARTLSNVTIMFADIVGFTAWSSTQTPTSVVEMLSELFTRFDKQCVKYDIYKVHTIGDCYVAMGYRGEIKRNPAKEAQNMAHFAISLIDIIEEVNKQCGCCLNMRIGMHTGTIIGGIAGTTIVRYDVYGKDVMIANAMESNGVAGRISISKETKELLEVYEENPFEINFYKDAMVQNTDVEMFSLKLK